MNSGGIILIRLLQLLLLVSACSFLFCFWQRFHPPEQRNGPLANVRVTPFLFLLVVHEHMTSQKEKPSSSESNSKQEKEKRPEINGLTSEGLAVEEPFTVAFLLTKK